MEIQLSSSSLLGQLHQEPGLHIRRQQDGQFISIDLYVCPCMYLFIYLSLYIYVAIVRLYLSISIFQLIQEPGLHIRRQQDGQFKYIYLFICLYISVLIVRLYQLNPQFL